MAWWRPIWLSGAVPERESWGDRQLDLEVLEFVQALAGLVFKYGGRIVTVVILALHLFFSGKQDGIAKRSVG